MPISAKCADCGKQYRLSDNAAGKSFSCKECGNKVRVPRPKPLVQEAEDPWDDNDQEAAEDSWDVEEEDYRPVVRNQSRNQNKSRSGSRNRKKRASKNNPFSVGNIVKIVSAAIFGLIVLLVFIGAIMKKVGNPKGANNPVANRAEDNISNWRQVKFDKEGLSIKMPDNAESRKKRTGPEGNTKYRSISEGILFMTNKFYGCEIACAHLPYLEQEATPQEKDAIHREFVKSVKEEVRQQLQIPGVTILEERDIKQKGLNGVRFRYTKDKMTITYWTFITEKAAVDINFFELSKSPKDSMKKQFIESLEIDGKKVMLK